MEKALVITGGDVSSHQLRSFYECYNLTNDTSEKLFIIGVDGGCAYCKETGIPLDLILGDFDTLDSKTKLYYQRNNVKTIELDPIKDKTDTHAAFDYIKEKDFESVFIFGGTGTRLDHSLANLMISFSYCETIDFVFIDAHNYIKPVVGPATIKNDCFPNEFDEFKYLSILPIEETIVSATKGLKYNIQNKNLKPFDSLGISNEITADGKNDFEICIESGRCLVIKSRD